MAAEHGHETDATVAMKVTRRPAWQVRAVARAPRMLIGALVLVLMAAGLRATVAGQPTPVSPTAPSAVMDTGALAFAEAFARAYLTWDPDRPELQQDAVSRFIVDQLDSGAGVDQRDVQSVLWASAAGVEQQGAREVVTVDAETDRGAYQLVVPVQRDHEGFLAVVGYPALVGDVATSLERELPDAPEVEDAQLRAVVGRAVRNYLAGERRNLLADLDPSAVVSLPDRPLVVRSLEEVAWSQPRRRVSARASVADGSTVLTLTYELAVVRRERWYVRAIAADPSNPPPRRTK